MTNEAKPSLKFSVKTLSLLMILDVLILTVYDLAQWTRRNWPKAEVYALTRYDLATRKMHWPPVQWIGITFVLSVASLVWFEILYKAAFSLIDGRMPCLA